MWPVFHSEPVGYLPLAESAVPVRQEQGFHFRAAMSTTLGQVTAQQCAEVGLDELDLRHISLGPHPQMLGVEVDVIHVERGQLAKPDPCAQQHLDHGAVAQRGEVGPSLELLEQTFLFGGGQEHRQLSRQPMHADGPGRIVLDHARLDGPGEKGPHRRLQMSAVLASRLDPGTITVLKGNKPLCLRIHRQHRVVLYASEAAFIDFAVDNEKGWRELEVPPMAMLTIRHADVRAIENSEFRFIPQERKGTLPEGVNA